MPVTLPEKKTKNIQDKKRKHRQENVAKNTTKRREFPCSQMKSQKNLIKMLAPSNFKTQQNKCEKETFRINYEENSKCSEKNWDWEST